MRFPGPRIRKHYFPVSGETELVQAVAERRNRRWCLLGLDQVLVDMEVRASTEFIRQAGLVPGESERLGAEDLQRLLGRIHAAGLEARFAPGGSVANSLNNYTFLSGEPAVLLGSIVDPIPLHGPAFEFVAQTPKGMDLSQLTAESGEVGLAITLVSEDGERTFAVSPGVSNSFSPDRIQPELVRGAAAVVTTLYTLADPSWPIAAATRRLMELATELGVPLAFGLGTAGLVRGMRTTVREILQRHVTIAAMNDREAEALTGESDPLLACERVLEWVDLAIVTEGARGMTIGGYVDRSQRRRTRDKVRSRAIPAYNRWEYSRLMQRKHCRNPIKTYTHIHPYQGGPDRMSNTNGAGDAALAAVLHDVAANRFHRTTVPGSSKHPEGVPFLTYSSLSRNAQYGNRVAYEVLRGTSPRLDSPVGPDRR